MDIDIHSEKLDTYQPKNMAYYVNKKLAQWFLFHL